ncbi:MAG: alpha/beta fold hydrolase [Bacteroidota bacterium]
MLQILNDFYKGSDGRKSLIDLEIPAQFNGELLLFVHGYMGYKDWGAWNLMQDYFVKQNFGFCKFNFSHNGGTLENGIDFPDLEAFSKNSYSKEVYDLQQVLNYLEEKINPLPKITLIGHSRGGGISLLNAHDKRIHKIIILASISSIEKRFSDLKVLDSWKESGVRYVQNQRTKQQMPHLYSQVEDFFENKEKLSIQKACEELSKPILIIHGNEDTSVPLEEALEIANWTKNSVKIIEQSDHVFGAKQPWESNDLPEKLKEVLEEILLFLK